MTKIKKKTKDKGGIADHWKKSDNVCRIEAVATSQNQRSQSEWYVTILIACPHSLYVDMLLELWTICSGMLQEIQTGVLLSLMTTWRLKYICI